MIPTSLKLHNFTAYGPNTPELNFRPLNLVVLSGNNGAGKSSVLDAITWCVWGWSRAGDNADRLVRLGQEEMWVEFSFELEGTPYTITRSRKTKGVGTTTLQFFAGSDRTNNLTEGTIRSTQEKIIDTLHLSYDTFVNSSYLRQNHADEFTLKGPTDRKKILADILGLDRYDQLEELAKLRTKEASDQINLLEVQINELEAEIASGSKHTQVQSETATKLQQIQAQLKLAEQTLAEVTARREKHTTKLEVQRSKAEQVAATRTRVAELELELNRKRDELIRYRELLAEMDEIEANYNQLVKTRAELRELEDIQTELIEVKDQALMLEREINQQKLGHEARLQQIKARAELVKNEISKLEQDLVKVKSAEAVCPTCGQKLGLDEHAKVEADLKTKLADKNNELISLRTDYKAAQEFKPTGQAELDSKKDQLKKLEQQTSSIDQLRTLIDRLTESEAKKRDLDVAVAQEKTITEAGKRDKDQLTKLQQELAKHGEVNLSELENELVALDREAQSADLGLRGLRQEEAETREALARAKELVSRVTQAGTALAKKKKDQTAAAATKTDYDELVLAFGKRGIQAMLIESAIPEIEEEANLLLNRLTDGRMQVRLVTQRANKTGGIAETLDIIISDELGARPYEMYSGGEAFRINLAIRLALSRLLTHRAGAKLQFLIIDEGFGTQDDQGKDKVVQAINAISNEFSKILVVTHDPDLKDAFPQRIEVVRGTAGSTFEVLA